MSELHEGRTWLAHSEGHSGRTQSQREHLTSVTQDAVGRCPNFLRDDVALAALFHDFGKYSTRFQRRLQGLESGLDHWSPGAHLLLSNNLSDLAGLAAHGHHVGLCAWGQVSTLAESLASLEGKTLTLSSRQELNDAFRAMLDDGFKPQDFKGHAFSRTVGSMLDVRMVLSALVDADYADTARHMHGEVRPKAPRLNAKDAFLRVSAYVASLSGRASAAVQSARTDLWTAAITAAEGPTGLYELEAPTGSGKTLAMLGFALRHITRHQDDGLRRIVVVLPFLSILDQTVREYRKALGGYADGLLEHHSLAAWRKAREEDGESPERLSAQALSEDWEAPIIITTSVQFLESLFSAYPATTRKLCAMSKAVILLDEAQSLPQHLIVPTLRAISRLCHSDYSSTVVVATATQPLFSRFGQQIEREKANVGWWPVAIAKRKLGLYERTRRYTVDWSRCEREASWEAIADEIAEKKRALCIVNTRKDARRLTELVQARNPRRPVFHLSTNMCAAHRRTVLDLETVLKPEAACLLISTQCVEAGVDLDFPIVYRALAPLDSIAQAAGRCNRAGRGTGEVRAFVPQEARYPGHAYEQGAQQTLALLRELGELDPQDPKVFDTYFSRLYDLTDHAGTSRKMESAVAEGDFPEVARIYRLIEHRDLLHIIVPYAGAPGIPERVTGSFFRNVQPYVVDANRKEAGSSPWLGSPLPGVEDWFVVQDESAYDEIVGLRLDQELPIV